MKILKKLSWILSKNWPVTLMLAIVFIFFWKFFIKGLIPISTDLLVGSYYPWLDYTWGFPTGVVVKNPITSDIFSFIYPMQTFAINLIKQNQLPLWNPLILGGTALMANFQSAAFSPTNIFYFLFDTNTAWSLQIIFQHFFALVTTYILLRSLKINKVTAIFGGAVYAFGGFNMIWSQWNGHALTAAFIPLVLYFLNKFLIKRRLYWLCLMSASLGLQVFSGYPQVMLYTFVAIGIWILVKAKFSIKTYILVAVFVSLGLGLSAIQIIPGAELLSVSQRSVEPHPFAWAFLPWSKTITFIAPDFFGNHSTNNYWGPQDYTSNTGFVGVIAVILAMLSLNNIRENKNILFGFLLATLGLALAFPMPVSIFLWKSGIFGMQAAAAHRSLVIFNLGVAMLAAFGLNSMNKAKFRRIIFSAFLLLLTVFGFALYYQNPVAYRNIIFPGLILAAIFILLAMRRLLGNVFGILILAVCLIELFRFGWKFTPFVKQDLVYPTTPVIEFLKKQEGDFRVIADKVIPINSLMAYDIQTLEGYDAVYPLLSSEYISAVNSGSLETAFRRYAIIDNLESKLASLANVKYLVVFTKDLEDFDDQYKLVFTDKSVSVLEDQNVLPRAFLTYSWEGASKEEALNKILNFQDLEKIYIQDLDIPVSQGSSEGKILNSQITVNRKLFEVDINADAMLFVSDTYYPGWNAYIDGNKTKIYQTDIAFQSVFVPEGKHKIEFIYQPESFNKGLFISVVSLIVILGTVYISNERTYNKLIINKLHDKKSK